MCQHASLTSATRATEVTPGLGSDLGLLNILHPGVMYQDHNAPVHTDV